jgi:hypothetical protein
MPVAVRDVRRLCRVPCGAETRDREGLCGVCGVRPNVRVHMKRVIPRHIETGITRTYLPPHTPHAPHNAGGARVSCVWGSVRGTMHPAQACSRGRATSHSPSLRKKGRGGLTQ